MLLEPYKLGIFQLTHACTTRAVEASVNVRRWLLDNPEADETDSTSTTDILHCTSAICQLSRNSLSIAQLVCTLIAEDRRLFTDCLIAQDDAMVDTSNLQLATIFLLDSCTKSAATSLSMPPPILDASLQHACLALLDRAPQSDMSDAIAAVRSRLATDTVANVAQPATQGSLKRKRGVSQVVAPSLSDTIPPPHWKLSVNAVLRAHLPGATLDGTDGLDGLLLRQIQGLDPADAQSTLRKVVCARANMPLDDYGAPDFSCAVCDESETEALLEQNRAANANHPSRCMSETTLKILLEQSATYLRSTVSIKIKSAYLQTIARALSHMRVPTEPSLVQDLLRRLVGAASSQLDATTRMLRLGAM